MMSVVSRFIYLFRCYLLLLALGLHIALLAAIVLVLALGPGRSIEYSKAIALKVKARVTLELAGKKSAREKQIEALLGKPSPDVYRFRAIPSANSDTLGYGRTLRVGHGAEFDRPSQAAKAARDGDVIEIAGGEYPGDTAIWRASDLIIRAKRGVARLDAAGTRLPQNKAIWIIQGNNIRIENIEFMNARSRDKNGAGIRAEGLGLHIVSCYFHDNEGGILTDNNNPNWLHIENSEFARNGHRSGQSHQIYVGQIDKFVLEGSYIHETNIGSAVKSRARQSLIRYNRIVDEGRGRSNYTVDISVGGEAHIIGNILQQGPATENYTLVTYAPEGIRWKQNELYITHNTIVSDRQNGNFIRNHSSAKAYVTNNLLVGKASPIEGPALLLGNIVDHGKGFLGNFDESLNGLNGSGGNLYTKDVGLVGRSLYDYRLKSNSPAVNTAKSLDLGSSKMFKPLFEYHHPLIMEARIIEGAPDVGALEYAPYANEKSQLNPLLVD